MRLDWQLASKMTGTMRMIPKSLTTRRAQCRRAGESLDVMWNLCFSGNSAFPREPLFFSFPFFPARLAFWLKPPKPHEVEQNDSIKENARNAQLRA